MSFKIMPYGGQRYKGHYANHHDIRQFFGFEPYERVPADFEARILLETTKGEFITATYKKGHVSQNGRRGKSSAHRVFVNCPCCQAQVPAGRTHQHKCR